MIPKRHGKDGQYEVTVPTWSDKLVAEVVRRYFPIFFKPHR